MRRTVLWIGLCATSVVASCTSGMIGNTGGDRDVATMADGDSGQVARPDGALTSDASMGIDANGPDTVAPQVRACGPQQSAVERVPPRPDGEIDPGARSHLAEQFAQLDTRTAPLGRLVVFLPGYTNTPGSWRDHGRKLAEFGFHVLIPHYNNTSTDACEGMGND